MDHACPEGLPRRNHVEGSALSEQRYGVLYAAPPWHELRDDAARLAAWCAWPVEELSAADALLFLWMGSEQLEPTIALGRAWGFEWATFAFAWHTMRRRPALFSVRQVELCAIMKRGRIPRSGGRRSGSRRERQWIEYPDRGAGLAPLEVLQRITAMFPDERRLLIGGRSDLPGWDSWQPPSGAGD